MAADAIQWQLKDDAGSVIRTFSLPFSKLDATTAPGVADDDIAGYVGGSLWIDRTDDVAYICTDNASGAAIWQEIGAAGGGEPSDGDKGDIIVTSTGTVWTIDNNVVTNAKLADMSADTIKARLATGGVPQNLGVADITTATPVGGDFVVGYLAAGGIRKFDFADFGGGTDADAIHDNVSGEIAVIAEKTTLVDDDLLLIEDSEASNAKKRVKISNLPSSGGAFVEIAGDTMTGDLTIANATPKLYLENTGTADKAFVVRIKPTHVLSFDGANDDGTISHELMEIDRDTGGTTHYGSVAIRSPVNYPTEYPALYIYTRVSVGYYTGFKCGDQTLAGDILYTLPTALPSSNGQSLISSAAGVMSWLSIFSFKTIAISGSSDIVADSGADTLTLISGTGISLVGDAGTDTITVSNTSLAFKTIAISGSSDVVADNLSDTLTFIAGTSIALTGDPGTDSVTIDAIINTFKTIAISGSSDLVADSETDTLTLIAGTNIALTGDPGTDSVTIAVAGLGTASTHADSDYVHIAGTETITGAKTFNEKMTFNGDPIATDIPDRGVRMQIGSYGSVSETLGGAGYIQGNNLAASPSTNNKLIKTASADSGQYIASRYDRGWWFGTGVGASDAAGTEYADTVNTRLSINLDGNVGLGLLSGSRQLSIYHSTAAAIGLFNSASGTDVDDGFQFQLDDVGYIWMYEALPIYFGTNGATAMVIHATGGGLNIGGATFGSGAAKNLVLSNGGTLGAATADIVSMAAIDNGAGNAEFHVQPEIGGILTYGSSTLRIGGPNGSFLQLKKLADELVTIAAAAFSDSSVTIPAGSQVLSVTSRVTVQPGGTSTFDIGISGSTTRYGTGISTAANTTSNGTLVGLQYYASATAIRITPNATPSDAAGRIRIVIWGIEVTPPTS